MLFGLFAYRARMSSSPWDSLAGSITSVNERFHQSVLAHRGFLPSSLAAGEVAGEPYADDWSQAPARNANIAGLHLAVVAMDHLVGLAILLRSTQPSIYGPSAVARSAMEVAARAHYLLDPGISALERIRRHQNDVLVALTERKRLVRATGGADTSAGKESMAQADTRINRILRSAERHGLIPKPKNQQPFIAAPGHPRPVTATGLADQAVGDGNGLGATFYQHMSAVTHGREHGIMQFFTHTGDLIDRTHGDHFGQIEATPQKTALYLSGAPLAVAAMLDRLYHRFGWPTERIAPAARAMCVVWATIGEVAPGADTGRLSPTPKPAVSPDPTT